MKSPFPGMDPFIEACGLWEDFHLDLIQRIKRALAAALPERYLVRSGERSYLVLVESEGKTSRPFVPDIKISTARRGRRAGKKAAAGVVESAEMEPIHMRAFIEEEHRESFVEIYESGPAQRLVTTLEVLSPSNKRPNTPGWDLYQRKRQGVLVGGVNLVEVDLLRGGQRPPMLDRWPASPYTLLVARGQDAGHCKVWPAYFHRPLPPLAVPLAKPDPDMSLSLQPLVDAVYQESHYDRTIDYTRPLMPKLRADERAWMEPHLRSLH